MDLFEVMSTPRAMRRLKPDPIPPELVRRCLEAATWAPSGSNRQPWRFLVVTEPALKDKIAEFYRAGGDAHRSYAPAPERPAGTRRSPGEYLSEHMGEAPVL